MVDLAREEREQRDDAARRVKERAPEREETLRKLAEPGGIAEADSPERIAKRLDRLGRYRAGEPVPIVPSETPSGAPAQVLAAAVERTASVVPAPEAKAAEPEEGGETAGLLERVINTADFVDIRYLEAGVAAARAVGRVNIRDKSERLAGYGSGSLVSPRLLLTNHHVLPSADVAQVSAIEFDYQDGLDGQPLQPRLFRFDPQSFFLADRERDFALVAVEADERTLAGFGFNRLIEAEGKAIKGEFVTIIQHPRGEKKQVALRENRIVDLVEAFLHYEADTEPGSSGSPVFNDQWEIVALHHASVPSPDRDEFGGYLNEGIRISRIIRFIREQELPAAGGPLVEQLLEPERIVVPIEPAGSTRTPPVDTEPADGTRSGERASGGEAPSLLVTIPLEVTIRVGEPVGSGTAGPGLTTSLAADAAEQEAIQIDPDYGSRAGYDPDFLGSGPHRVLLPSLPAELAAKASTSSAATAEPRYLLDYHHFSVVMNRERRLAFFTASNIDGRLSRRLKREPDRWFRDPRIPAEEQTDEAVYDKNDLDRGHLVRRLDPAWGSTPAEAKRGNDDSFHFTNCTPQHKKFNQNKTTWAGLEDYILDNADNRDFKISVFTGPVLAEDDDDYRSVKLPRQFWKVVAMVRESGQLSATGYLLSQEELLRGLERLEEFSYGAYRTFQVPITRIEALSGLDFAGLKEADPLAGLEATVEAKEVNSANDLEL